MVSSNFDDGKMVVAAAALVVAVAAGQVRVVVVVVAAAAVASFVPMEMCVGAVPAALTNQQMCAFSDLFEGEIINKIATT